MAGSGSLAEDVLLHARLLAGTSRLGDLHAPSLSAPKRSRLDGSRPVVMTAPMLWTLLSTSAARTPPARRRRDAHARGEDIVNRSEQRAALHVLLRDVSGAVCRDGRGSASQQRRRRRARGCGRMAEQVHSSDWRREPRLFRHGHREHRHRRLRVRGAAASAMRCRTSHRGGNGFTSCPASTELEIARLVERVHPARDAVHRVQQELQHGRNSPQCEDPPGMVGRERPECRAALVCRDRQKRRGRSVRYPERQYLRRAGVRRRPLQCVGEVSGCRRPCTLAGHCSSSG